MVDMERVETNVCEKDKVGFLTGWRRILRRFNDRCLTGGFHGTQVCKTKLTPSTEVKYVK